MTTLAHSNGTDFVVLDFGASNQVSRYRVWTRFEATIVATSLSDVPAALNRVAAAVSAGQYAVGFLTYEAAAAFDNAMRTHPPDPALPLLWFGICSGPAMDTAPSPTAIIGNSTPSVGPSRYRFSRWQPALSRRDYSDRLRALKTHIADGDAYQINFTFPLTATFAGNVGTLYQDLVNAHNGQYGAWIHTRQFDIVSASPELFFRVADGKIVTRPMKGTRRRGRFLREDEELCAELLSNPKERAENVMIVDLLRNDLGRIANYGSVRVPSLFDIERYRTVLQMTSTVTAELRPGVGIRELLSALFPSASVTGAPKIKAMELIARNETSARTVYCGCIGVIAPGMRCQFNVAIRTLLIHADGRAAYHVGSGIVADSVNRQEYDECLAKARVLKRVRWPEFQLLETISYRPGVGFWLLARHLDRLRDSAAYFQFPCDPAAIQSRLLKTSAAWDAPTVVRLLLGANGELRIQSRPHVAAPTAKPITLRLTSRPVRSDNIFLYHKTTYRKIYEAAKKRDPTAGDVVLYNEKGEATETTIANIAVELGGQWVTPAVTCGLLGGTMRAELLARGEIVEGTVRVDDLRPGVELRLFNSVRGQYKGTLLP